MSCAVTIRLKQPVTEITREEILKQAAHLSHSLRHPHIPSDGLSLEFEVADEEAERTRAHAEQLCAQIQRSLRQLQRKVVYQTRAMSNPAFRGDGASAPGIRMAGRGQVMLEGLPLKLFNWFDAALADLEREWSPQGLLTPTLIPTDVLARCNYFRSFPHAVTFACHLRSEADVLNAFRARHEAQPSVDGEALADMAHPEACLSPAVCYHVYHRNQGATVPDQGVVYAVRGKCFRYESSNLNGISRLWDFTMRELVFLGAGQSVQEHRQKAIERVGAFFDDLELAAEIRTASDPFYIAPDAPARTYFQLTAETKFEVSALLAEDQRLAVGSLNHHGDFFGGAFDIHLSGGEVAHSGCIGFGLERLVCAFLAQHGTDLAHWPVHVTKALNIGN